VTGGRGGRSAVLPGGDWQPIERFAAGGAGTVVRFVEEASGSAREFDFAALPVESEVQRWLAGAFARRVGPRSGVKRVKSATAIYGVCRLLAKLLAESPVPVPGPEQITAAHMAQFVLRYAGMSTGRTNRIELRALLRDDPHLPQPARERLLAGRIEEISPEDRDPVVACADREWQLLVTALRRDVRKGRDRIRAGRALLDRFRSGELDGGAQERFGSLLDAFDRTGGLPRKADGRLPDWVSRAGGLAGVSNRLCLTVRETTAFCLLLTALTGENFGTVAAWPAVSHHPGGLAGTDGLVVLLEQVKPRRGPDHEHRVRALEDVPGGLADLLTGEEGEERLFRSPARLYRLLIDLTEVPRRFSGGQAAFTTHAPGHGKFLTGVTGDQVRQWRVAAGFPCSPAAAAAGDGAMPLIEVARIRQTVIERARRPISQTRTTMNDHYLARSQNVHDDSRIVVADALRGEVAKARSAQAVTVFTTAFMTRFAADPAGAAAEADLDEPTLEQMASGERDTAVTACADHLSGPHTPAGIACTASFLACLDCPNARALPHHLPAQLAMADHIRQLRPHLDPPLWQMRYEPRLRQLEQIFRSYTPAELDRARQAVTKPTRGLVGDVLTGRWDLR
jgi:hypothetical protein